MRFIENLDYLLRVNNMSRSELARAINIAPSTVNAWFNRSCDGVALKSLVEIANYFDVTLDDLVNGENLQEKAVKILPFSELEVETLRRIIKRYETENDYNKVEGV